MVTRLDAFHDHLASPIRTQLLDDCSEQITVLEGPHKIPQGNLDIPDSVITWIMHVISSLGSSTSREEMLARTRRGA